MKPIIEHLKENFQFALQSSFPQLAPQEIIEITQSTQEQFGDYQCNSAMKLTKQLKKNPREIAQTLVDYLNLQPGSTSWIQKLEVAGPGFINIWVQPSYLEDQLTSMFKDPQLGVEIPQTPKKILIDFSSPNTAKEMHVGHLRSTIIGDCLARLFEFLGHHVVRINHVGDWGTAFGMLLAYIREESPDFFSGRSTATLETLASWYKASKQRFDSDEAFKKRSQLEVVALQKGQEDSLKAWQLICEVSRRAYQEIYDLLDIKLMERGESFYNPMLADVVQELQAKGIVEISDGAKCIFLEGFKNREGEPLPLMIQKSDGGYNYDTTDMAAIRHRIIDEKADQLIYITDAGQSTHFQMIFKAAEKAGYLDPTAVKCDHVFFGVVLGPDGKKFKTRSGEVEKLIDLIQTAIAKAKELLLERKPEIGHSEELHQTAAILGINAIKYADLSCLRTADYMFSYDRMLRFEGNTAAFLMYAYVRIAGIKRKIGQIPNSQDVKIRLSHPSELALGLHLLRFHETLENVAKELLPNRLTDYLFNLAEKFHAFFRDCRVEGVPEQNERLQLCTLTANTLKQGMALLGLKTVERM